MVEFYTSKKEREANINKEIKKIKDKRKNSKHKNTKHKNTKETFSTKEKLQDQLTSAQVNQMKSNGGITDYHKCHL